MIVEFLLPIIGWLVLFIVCFVIYSAVFYKDTSPNTHVEGQGLYSALAAFFWIVVYICLSSIWSVLYSLIDLKYPDVIGAATSYAYGSIGAAYDTFAFPLAMILVSSITALILAFWLISKFQSNNNLRPERLYSFMRMLVYLGGSIMAFFGFVYIVYSWLYGNLPVAVFMKAGVAVAIVGAVALYFYLTSNADKAKDATISRTFAIILVLVTIATLFFSFKVVGTPAEARMYRLDSITLANLQSVKQEIDNKDQSFAHKIQGLSEITNEYTKAAIKQTDMTYSSTATNYTLCAEFNSDMPQTLNQQYRNEDWDYTKGQNCFTFPHLPTYANGSVNVIDKPVYRQ